MRRRTANAWRPSANQLVAAVCAVYVVLCLCWNWFTPAYEGFDEPSHVGYVEQIVTTGHIPQLPSPNLEAHQPPAYYLLETALVKLGGLQPPPQPRVPPVNLPQPRALWDHRGECHLCGGMVTLRLMRLVSTGLGLLTLLLVFATLAQVLADRYLAALGTALVALIPQFQYVTSTVNNDALMFAVGAAFGLTTVAVVRSTTDRRFLATATISGALLGLGLLSKEYAFALIPVFALAVTLARVKALRKLGGVVAGAAAGLLVAAPLLWRNWRLYHALWPFQAELANIARILPASVVPRSLTDPVMWRVMPVQMWLSFWFSGGSGQIKLPGAVYWALLLAVVPGVAGALVALATRRRGPAAFDLRAVIPLLSAPVFLYAGSFYSALHIQQWPGRYLFPGLCGIALWLALIGLRPAGRRYLGALAVVLLGLSISAILVSARVLLRT